MASEIYLQKLKDPRWQKKRLQIFERDNWTCQKYGNKNKTLAIHHRLYLNNREPWDYSDDLLITLFVECHELEQINLTNTEKNIVEILKIKFLAEGINELCCGLYKLELFDIESTVGAAYGYAFSNKTIQRNLLKTYNNHIMQITNNLHKG